MRAPDYDPVNYVDPSGHKKKEWFSKRKGIVLHTE